MIYLKNQSHTPKDATALLKKARNLVSDSKIIVRDTRVSKRRIEFDTSIPENYSVENIIDKLSFISPISEYEHVVEKHMKKEEEIKYARALFNDEKYWGAHEVLESIWKSVQKDEKDLLNGIILIAAAFVHDEKGESDICISILKRAMNKLSKANGLYFDIDVDKLKDRVLKIIQEGHIEQFLI